MIVEVVANRFGKWLKAARLSTIDPSTGQPFTQERVGDLMNISPSKVAAWERGAIASISPEDAEALARILGRAQREILGAIGYDVEDIALSQEERELLAAYRRLGPDLRPAVIRVAQALPESQSYRPRRRRTAARDGNG